MQTIDRKQYKPIKSSVVALGNFDGVHLGHAELIRSASYHAAKEGLLSCVYTFADHPSNFKEDICSLITDNSEKIEIIQRLGADLLCFDDFDSVKELSCREFCRDILVGALGCEIAVCGRNYRFGKQRSGDCRMLCEQMEALGKKVIVIDDVTVGGVTVNSTLVRKLILEGDMEGAATFLGRRFSMSADVLHGKQLGRILNAPTINQLFPDKKIKPKNGVYVCLCNIGGKIFPGVANVGINPTVNETDMGVVCETHIIGFSGDLYGANVKLEFCTRLRDEKKFSSLEELKAEIARNVQQAQEYFEKEIKGRI